MAHLQFDNKRHYPTNIEHSPMDASLTPVSTHNGTFQDQLACTSYAEPHYQPSPCVGIVEPFPQAPHGLGLFIDTHDALVPTVHPPTPISANPWNATDLSSPLNDQQRLDFYLQVSGPPSTWEATPVVDCSQLQAGVFTPCSNYRTNRSHRSSISSTYSSTDSILTCSRGSPLPNPVKIENVENWQLTTPEFPSTPQGRNLVPSKVNPPFIPHSAPHSAHVFSYVSPVALQEMRPHSDCATDPFYWQNRRWSDSYSAERIKAEALHAVARTRKKRRHTTQAESKFSCDQCGKFFKRKHNFTSHCNTRHNKDTVGLRPFPCNACDRAFKRKADLERHRTNVHIKSLEHKHVENGGCKTLNDLERQQSISASPLPPTPMF
ncbi:hypothetical protein P152DRAFT_480359 [Eremomyces bilateralis CBS 781.70]|uniref:C2H2-type domain-containing protein n=1 Tax=Eremomyces bilateralis CBS 781.70 TaxID=1392243 RepID=A0A6G1G7T8_9PEZI|nr:uncharacterized protein P152DRAFT_480359 [Eremomyces bilateralis CBS 781.70]KAF1814128.1 hypothetical protein P152DRAFT_480359 [Eremomyces bilateralis CBS 781.70]